MDPPAHARQEQALVEGQPGEDGHQHIRWQVQELLLAARRGHGWWAGSGTVWLVQQRQPAGAAAVGPNGL